MKKTEIGLFELYEQNEIEADRKVFGRISNSNRRGFLKGAGLATMSAMVGSVIPFSANIPRGFIPIALASTEEIEGKDGLTILNDRPINAETPPHLLNDAITPTARHFIRNNGHPPDEVNPETWQLRIEGEVDSPTDYKIADLKNKFEVVTENLTIECGGNGRAFFNPPAKGNQWTYGAVACSSWTGVRLADVLNASGVKKSSIYTAHEGADTHLSGTEGKLPISRGVPIEKAMNPHNLIAFAQNGNEIHPMNGAPLRLVIPGWPGSCSQKWLTKIYTRPQVHDGAKMTGTSYRVPNRPVEPGEKVDEADFNIIEAMPVKSIITSPMSESETSSSEIEVRGHAWAGDDKVEKVVISIDFGATWIETNLTEPTNPYAWQHFNAKVSLPVQGYYEIWARATSDKGVSQPHAIAWNPKGYLNNSMHRVSVKRTG